MLRIGRCSLIHGLVTMVSLGWNWDGASLLQLYGNLRYLTTYGWVNLSILETYLIDASLTNR